MFPNIWIFPDVKEISETKFKENKNQRKFIYVYIYSIEWNWKVEVLKLSKKLNMVNYKYEENPAPGCWDGNFDNYFDF